LGLESWRDSEYHFWKGGESMSRVAVILAVAAIMIGGVIYLGWMQNSERVTQLSLNLGPAGAWQLAQPVSIPVLIAGCFGVGFSIGAIAFIGRSMRLSRRVRRLEQQVSLTGSENSSTEWS
jgi:uncharacterized integral membrane protein